MLARSGEELLKICEDENISLSGLIIITLFIPSIALTLPIISDVTS